MPTIDAVADPVTTGVETTPMIKALVYAAPASGRGRRSRGRSFDTPGDTVVRITTTTICGTDLHIMKGRPVGHARSDSWARRHRRHRGRRSGRTTFRKGDRVLISCVSACGICDLCRKGMYSHCRTGGWILGNTIDATERALKVILTNPAVK